MRISNANLGERIELFFTAPKARIEIFSIEDFNASRKLKKFAYRVAERLSSRHLDLKIIEIYKTDDPYNIQNPYFWGMFHAYAITIPRNSNLQEIKRTCIELEHDCFGLRICDIDVYETRDKKISRTDLGYSKDLS
ncbi:MAG: citrate lyase holo-[acyl-carrier protein] synthase [archaeon]